jgi:hypothetical protein
MSMKKYLFLSLFIIILLAGCSKPTEPKTDPTATPVPAPTATPVPSKVYFYNVTASPTDAEQITLINNSGVTKDLSNWKLGDLNDPRAYNIPSGTTLTQGQTHSFSHTTLGFQINDSAEVLYLIDATGNTIDTWGN